MPIARSIGVGDRRFFIVSWCSCRSSSLTSFHPLHHPSKIINILNLPNQPQLALKSLHPHHQQQRFVVMVVIICSLVVGRRCVVQLSFIGNKAKQNRHRFVLVLGSPESQQRLLAQARMEDKKRKSRILWNWLFLFFSSSQTEAETHMQTETQLKLSPSELQRDTKNSHSR